MATAAECAAHLDISARGFRELLDDGHIERQPAGSYDLDAVRVAYIRRLRSVASGREGNSELAAARTRIAEANAKLKEIKIAEATGEFVPAAEVEACWLRILATVRTHILAIPNRCAAQVRMASSTTEVAAILRAVIYEILGNLSTVTVVREPPPTPIVNGASASDFAPLG